MLDESFEKHELSMNMPSKYDIMQQEDVQLFSHPVLEIIIFIYGIIAHTYLSIHPPSTFTRGPPLMTKQMSSGHLVWAHLPQDGTTWYSLHYPRVESSRAPRASMNTSLDRRKPLISIYYYPWLFIDVICMQQ